MPAYAEHQRTVRPRERAAALTAVVLVQAALAFALLTGLRVPVTRPRDAVERLIDLTLPKPRLERPERPPQKPKAEPKSVRAADSAPKAAPTPPGGSPGQKPAHAPASVAPVIAVRPTVAPSGGGVGTGPAMGSGSGGGTGGSDYGAGEGGGTDLEQIAGEITPRDYPRHLGRAGIGGRVGLVFTVATNGRVSRCRITSSSGIPELDALTCRLIMQRFIFRPGTDRYGRPVSDDIEGEHIWEAGRR